ATLSSGEFYTVSELDDGEVLSVQSDGTFTYQVDIPEAPAEPEPEVPPPGTTSQVVTWTCTGADCPWGFQLANDALVWPDSAQAGSARLGYTTSKPIYLPANRANGAVLHVLSGNVSLYAGEPNAA